MADCRIAELIGHVVFTHESPNDFLEGRCLVTVFHVHGSVLLEWHNFARKHHVCLRLHQLRSSLVHPELGVDELVFDFVTDCNRLGVFYHGICYLKS